MSSFLSGETRYVKLASQTTAAYEQAFGNRLHTKILLLVRFADAPMSARELADITRIDYIFPDLALLRRAYVLSAERIQPAGKRHNMVYSMTSDQIQLFDFYFESIGGSSRTPSRKVISVNVHSALADEGLRTILSLLAWHGSLTVMQLVRLTLRPQATISGHLDALSSAGLVSIKNDGRRHICTVTANAVDAVCSQLKELTELNAEAKP
jgi:DNA-binding transcriptional ArsR family regulator